MQTPDSTELGADEQDVKTIYEAFHSAWYECCKDYKDRRINAEHTLQAALYFHLRKDLPPSLFVVFTELTARLSETSSGKTSKSKDVLDLVVARRVPGSEGKELEILAAIELKFLPRGVPKDANIRKDLASLSRVWRYKDSDNRSNFSVERFNGPETKLTVRNERVLIYGIVAAKSKTGAICGANFWQEPRIPENCRWSQKKRPSNLVVAYCLAEEHAEDGCTNAEVSFDGPLHEKYVGPSN